MNPRTSARIYDDGRARYLNKSNIFRTLIDGERVNLKWPIYSELTGLICWYAYKLFSFCHVSLTIELIDWKYIHRLSEHEDSTTQKGCIFPLCAFGWQTERLDKSMGAQVQNKQDNWRIVLRRDVSVVKFLASSDLPFRGRDVKIGSNHQWKLL